jgi:Lrp/AsnC family leucine-responsive transcriptional regulator
MWEDILKGKIDDIDIKIMNFLLNSGRMSDKAIGDKLKLSKSAVRARRLKLQDNNYIKFVGIPVLQNLNLIYIDMLIKLNHNKNYEDIKYFIDNLKNNDHVYEITEYIGDYDFLIRVFDNSLPSVKNQVAAIRNLDIIDKCSTVVATKSYKAWGVNLNSIN